jgi:hypothetical protein
MFESEHSAELDRVVELLVAGRSDDAEASFRETLAARSDEVAQAEFLAQMQFFAERCAEPWALLMLQWVAAVPADDLSFPAIDRARELLEDRGVSAPASAKRASVEHRASLPTFQRLLVEVGDLLRADGISDADRRDAIRARLTEAASLGALPRTYTKLLRSL